MKKQLLISLLPLLLASTAPSAAENWSPYPVVRSSPAFSDTATQEVIEYQALAAADKAWKLCASFPHMKDAYWLGVNYGLVAEAKRQGVGLNLFEAGGYTQLSKQLSQLEDCVAGGADAVIVGAISYDGLNNVIAEIAEKGIPVIDLVNGVSSQDIRAKSLVSFYTMGQQTGHWLAEKHPAGSKAVQVGWFPGPAGAGWVEAAHKGFMEAVAGSAVDVLEPRFGDTGKETQLRLVEDVLQANPDVAYLAGTAVTAEAAQGLVRERGLVGKVGLLAFYMTPGVFAGIERGYITAAPADSMVIQGRIAVDQAIRALQGNGLEQHVGPEIFVVDKSNIATVSRDAILPPADFKPTFSVSK